MFGSNLRMVPWRDKEEWTQVYRDAYSSDPLRQAGACCTMELWLLVRNDVPPGVECTVNLLTALTLTSSRQGQSASASRQMQLTLSTAVLRVINMLCDNARVSEKQTMFSIAKLYNLPEWIVSLRHDVSHGSLLPPLSSLQSAATFLLAWLKEMYWEVEAEQIEREEVVLKRSVDEMCRENVQYLLDLYLDLMHLSTSQNSTTPTDPLLTTLPTTLRLRVEDVSRRRGLGVAIESMPWIRHGRESFSKELTVGSKGSRVSGLVGSLLTQLQDYLPVRQVRRAWHVDTLPTLVSTMLQHFKLHNGVERKVWQPLVERLNSWQLLDRTVSQLCSEEGGREWLLELSLAAAKRHRVERLQADLSMCQAVGTVEETRLAGRTMRSRRLGLPAGCSERVVLERLFSKVERRHPELRQVLRLTGSVCYMVDSCSAVHIMRTLLSSPDSHTLSILNQLMVLVEPELSREIRAQLADLLLIRLGEKTLSKLAACAGIKTVSHLLSATSQRHRHRHSSPPTEQWHSSSDPTTTGAVESPRHQPQSQFTFIRSGWDFSGCPLGVSPWELEGCEYYHVPYREDTPCKQYLFPLSPRHWLPPFS